MPRAGRGAIGYDTFMMQRREWFWTALAGWGTLRADAAIEPALQRAKALRPGDTVGVVTPSTGVTDPDDLAKAERTLRYFGLKYQWGEGVGKRFATYEESVKARIADLHRFFADPGIRGVLAVRGGYGATQLLDGLDYQLIRRNPKIFLGYSDITALHLAIHRYANLITFHGPVLLSAFSEYTEQHWRKALFSTAPLGVLANPPETSLLRPAHAIRTIRGRKARGRLTGGNLSLIAATMGTPYEIDTAGKILFLEDVGEQPYSIDRMLTHLRLAGKLQAAAGIVFGECNDCGPRDFRPSFASVYTLGETLDNLLGSLKIPVVTGLTIGHTPDQLTLPLGVMATLDADAGTLTLEEPALTD